MALNGKSPCFPFYPSDFFGDVKVRVMSADAQAFYLLLLANIWEFDTQYSIPDDEKIISKLLNIDEQRTSVLLFEIRPCFFTHQGRLISKRLKREKVKQDNYRKQQSDKGKRSAQQRFNHGSTTVQPDTQPKVNCSNPIPIPIPNPITNKKQVDKIALPEWIKKETWDAYLEMRKRKRAPMTDRAVFLIVKELEKLKSNGNNPEDVLNQSIMKSYTGVFPLSQGGGNGGNRTGKKDGRTQPESSPYKKCTKCGEEYMEGDMIDIQGVKSCPKCPAAREESGRLAKVGYDAVMAHIETGGFGGGGTNG